MSIENLSVRQLKAARALLAWTQHDLAAKSGVSYPTIARLEKEDGPVGGRSATVAAICDALEAAGITIRENGDVGISSEESVRRYLQQHPEIERQFEAKRRFWVPYIPRPQLPIFTKVLSEYFSCPLQVFEIQPNFEFVFFDPEEEGNEYEALREVAHQRAGF